MRVLVLSFGSLLVACASSLPLACGAAEPATSPGSTSANATLPGPSITSFDLGDAAGCTASPPTHAVCDAGAACAASIDVVVSCGAGASFGGWSDVLLGTGDRVDVLTATSAGESAVVTLNPSGSKVAVNPSNGIASYDERRTNLVHAGLSDDLVADSVFINTSTWTSTPIGGPWTQGFDRGADSIARVIVTNGPTWMVAWDANGVVSTQTLPSGAQLITASPNGTLSLLTSSPPSILALDGSTSPLPSDVTESNFAAKVRADGELPYVSAWSSAHAPTVFVPTASGYVATRLNDPVAALPPSACEGLAGPDATCTAHAASFQGATIARTDDNAIFSVALWQQIDVDYASTPSPSDPASYVWGPVTADRSVMRLAIYRVPGDGSPAGVSLDVLIDQPLIDYGLHQPYPIAVDERGTKLAIALPSEPVRVIVVATADLP